MFLDKQGPTEFDLGKTIVDALIAADVKNLVYSSFVSTREYTGGAIPMKTMDGRPTAPHKSVVLSLLITIP